MTRFSSRSELNRKLEYMTSKISNAVLERSACLVNYIEFEQVIDKRTTDVERRRITKDTYVNVEVQHLKDIPVYTFHRTDKADNRWVWNQPIIDYVKDNKYEIHTAADLELKPGAYLIKFIWMQNEDDDQCMIWTLKLTQCLGTFGKAKLMERKYDAVLYDITSVFPNKILDRILEREYQRAKINNP